MSGDAIVDSGIPAAIAGGTSGADPADRGGLSRIASAAADAGGKKRGPYKCGSCGKRHDKGLACSSAAAKEAGKPARESARAQAAAAPRPDLFTPESTARLVRVPFALAAIRTHCPHLHLDDKQEKELAATGSVVLNEWVAIDPKFVALGLFAISLAGVAFEKVLVYSLWLKQQELELEKLKLAAAQNRAPAAPPAADAPAAPAAPFAPVIPPVARTS